MQIEPVVSPVAGESFRDQSPPDAWIGHLVRAAVRRGVVLWTTNGELCFRAPQGMMTGELKDLLRRRRGEVIDMLSGPMFRRREHGPKAPVLASHHDFYRWAVQGELSRSFSSGTHFAITVHGAFDTSAFMASVAEVMTRHSILGARICASGGVPHFIVDRERQAETFVGRAAGRTEPQRAALISDFVYREFDVGQDPLFRVFVLEISSREYTLGFVVHHAIADDWSVAVLAQDLLLGYAAAKANQVERQRRMPFQYVDYVHAMNDWMQGEAIRFRLEYWREHLALAPETRLPIKSGTADAAMGTVRYQHFHIPPDAAASLEEAASRSAVSLSNVVFTAFLAALAQCCSQDDVAAIVFHAGRDHAFLTDVVGLTVNYVPIRVRVDRSCRCADLLEQVQSAWRAAHAHQVPYGFVEQMLKDTQRPHSFPMINFVSKTRLAPVPPLPQIHTVTAYTVDGVPPEVKTAGSLGQVIANIMHDLEGIHGEIDYLDALYDSGTVRSFTRVFAEKLMELAGDSAGSIRWPT